MKLKKKKKEKELNLLFSPSLDTVFIGQQQYVGGLYSLYKYIYIKFSRVITFGLSLYNQPVSPLGLITLSLELTLWERGQNEGGQELSDRVEMSEPLLDAICLFHSRSLDLLI